MLSGFTIFEDDDAGYLHWLEKHLDGWVLNVPRRKSGTILEHRSTCSAISNNKGSNWTGKHYYKVVAPAPEALKSWMQANWTGKVRGCSRCANVVRARSIGPRSTTEGTTRSTGENTKRTVVSRSSEVLKISGVTQPWKLWSPGRPAAVLDDVEPQIDSWDHKAHVNQVRLQAYLQPVREYFRPALEISADLAIGLTVDLKRQDRLFSGNDVDNYLIPLVKALGWRRFVYAHVEKRVGGGSRIEIGPAIPRAVIPDWQSWAGRVEGPLATEEGKRSVRLALLRQHAPLPPGPIAVHMAWGLSSSRNWLSLWKPTGDTLGPVVGESRIAKREFHPNDDRITKLTLHRCINEALDPHVVDVGLWWSSANSRTLEIANSLDK